MALAGKDVALQSLKAFESIPFIENGL